MNEFIWGVSIIIVIITLGVALPLLIKKKCSEKTVEVNKDE